MISVEKELKRFILFCLPILMFFNTSLSVVAAEEMSQEEKTPEILKQLVFTEQESETAKKWELYIKERTWFTDEEHHMAIIHSGLDFAASVSYLNDCIDKTEQNKKKYSSEWIKDFQKQFDQAYIKKNMDSITFAISCMYARDNLKCCEEQKKEALYREIIYRQAFEDYIRHLQLFSETLDMKERNKVDERLNVAKTYLDGPPYPLQVLLSPGRGRLFTTALNTRKDLDPVLIDFFLSHPFFQEPFDPIKAIKDLEALEGQRQS
jgi:hypothetical protein